MRTPGGAWLEWRLEPCGANTTRLHQRAVFFPKGLAGQLYWYSLMPFHGIVFTGMANNIAVAAGRVPRSPGAVTVGASITTRLAPDGSPEEHS
jgi:hypothetical protein